MQLMKISSTTSTKDYCSDDWFSVYLCKNLENIISVRDQIYIYPDILSLLK